jgi:phosphoglycolate phosphatase-like HAD superfamily hydrolase
MADVRAAAPRLWLFDIDGTLIPQSADQLEAWVAVFREVYGVAVAPAEIAPHLGQTFAKVVQAVVADRGGRAVPSSLPQALAVYLTHVCDVLTRHPPALLPGARDCLEFLKQRGEWVGVVTGNFREEGDLKLRATGLLPLLDVVTYADLATPARAAMVRQAVQTARARGFPNDLPEVVVVGDSVHDVASALSNGAMAIAVCTGMTPSGRLLAAGPTLCVADLSQLLFRIRREGVPWLLSAHPV